MSKPRKPKHFRITKKKTYEVLYTDGFMDRAQLAECRCHSQQILLMRSRKKREKELDLVHELIEAINYEHQVGLNHPQIERLEVALHEFFRLNKINL